MDTPDSHLDDWIHDILEADSGGVSGKRKALAWERLREEAGNQVILAPYAVPPRQQTHAPRTMRGWLQLGIKSLRYIMMDDSRYWRASDYRYHDLMPNKYRFGNIGLSRQFLPLHVQVPLNAAVF